MVEVSAIPFGLALVQIPERPPGSAEADKHHGTHYDQEIIHGVFSFDEQTYREHEHADADQDKAVPHGVRSILT